MADPKIQLFFDKEYKIRVLDPVKFEKNELLEKECGNFVDKINSFNDKVASLVEILEQHANRIDAQKLRVSNSALFPRSLDRYFLCSSSF